MRWVEEDLDVVLVPSGLLIMFGYHLFLLYKCRRDPKTTVIGYENHNKKAWVEKMLLLECKDRGVALTVIGSKITSSTFLCSTSLILSSLIGTWVGGSSNNIFKSSMIYGNTSESIISVKYVSLLICFLLAFASFVQATRNFVQANLLMCMPRSDIPLEYLQKVVLRGGTFWSIGLRALYFATTLLLWVFGPIPMFLSSVFMVAILYSLDMNSLPLHPYQPVRDVSESKTSRAQP